MLGVQHVQRLRRGDVRWLRQRRHLVLRGPEQMQAAAIEMQKAHIPVIETPPPPPPPPTASANVKKLNPIKLKQMQDRVRFAEEEMPRLEDRMTALETAMSNFVSAEESQRQTAELAELRSQHESLMLEWEDLSMQLEEQGASV